jgi:hypothetical protein
MEANRLKALRRWLLIACLIPTIGLGGFVVTAAIGAQLQSRAMDACVNHPAPRGVSGTAIGVRVTSFLPPRFECVGIDYSGRVVSHWKARRA